MTSVALMRLHCLTLLASSVDARITQSDAVHPRSHCVHATDAFERDRGVWTTTRSKPAYVRPMHIWAANIEKNWYEQQSIDVATE